jgi:hypothetical protein
MDAQPNCAAGLRSERHDPLAHGKPGPPQRTRARRPRRDGCSRPVPRGTDHSDDHGAHGANRATNPRRLPCLAVTGNEADHGDLGQEPSALAIFEVPDHAEVLVVTHLLELPRDLGLPQGINYAIVQPRDDIFLDWPDQAKAEFIGMSDMPSPDASPVIRLTFCRTYVPERAPLIAAHLAFEGWIEPVATKEELEVFRGFREMYMSEGSLGWVTTVAATRFVPAREWPPAESDRAALLGRELDASLSVLNQFIVSLSLARQEPRFLPVARGDLPLICPVILETAPMPDAVRHGAFVNYQIHEVFWYEQRPLRDKPDDAELLAVQLARANFHGSEPYFSFYELMQQAIGQFNEGRYGSCAISTGTAVEVLIATTIREAGRVRGESEIEYATVLNAPLRNQVEHHLPRYANCIVDLNDQGNAFGAWWVGGYKTRNRVVHEAHRPTREEIDAALLGAQAVATALKAGLLSDPVTAEVGELLQWGPTGESS